MVLGADEFEPMEPLSRVLQSPDFFPYYLTFRLKLWKISPTDLGVMLITC